jgi:glycine hydroxymethyltransferase
MLQQTDTELWEIIQLEQKRQNEGIELIASENFTSQSVIECLGSCLTNKYSEGLPGRRYYGGNQFIDKIEILCQKRALQAFHLDPSKWGVNVQPYSGSVANLAVYLGVLKPHDRIMGLDLPSGGHLTHGFMTSKKRVSASSVYYESVPYKVDKNGYINYDAMEHLAEAVKPRLIICGASAYSRDFDYERFRKIANLSNSYLMADIAHISGFVATGEMRNPFDYCDIVTTTTHKSLRGPRAGLIFYRKELETLINDAVFPGLQGGPHQNQIAAVATQLKEVMTPEYKSYIQQIKKNVNELIYCLKNKDYKIVTDGSDNHLFLVDLRNKNINGAQVEKILEEVNISVNKNTIPGDLSALNPNGIRIGLCAMTTRGLKEIHMEEIADIIDSSILLALRICDGQHDIKLQDFSNRLENYKNEIEIIKNRVKNFTKNYCL